MMFHGRKLLIVTKHGKEQVIAPLAEQALGVECMVTAGFDTDLLGTFTGEVPREGNALDALRRKCREGMALYGCDLAIASEGSFGPHPVIFLAPADDELLLLMDAANELEVVARELTLETNFRGAEIRCRNELDDFLTLAKFPDHAVIVRKSADTHAHIIKGIRDYGELVKITDSYLEKFGRFYIETDMRAMHNPSRMEAIKRAMLKLLDKVQSLCPRCGTPGFGVTAARPGLSCGACGNATAATLSHIYTCTKCGCQLEKLHPSGRESEDPMYCDICNP